MLHRIILVLTLLVAVSCTGDDTVIERVETKIQCPNGDLIEEGETCPTTPTTPTTPDTDTDRGGPTRSDCNIQVQGVNLDRTTGSDLICGNDRDNTIKGLAGDDTIYGGPGNDTLIGGDGRDVLRGEAGDDTLTGGQDDDTLDGGPDTDTADYSQENNPDTTGVDPVEVNLAEGQATDAYGDLDTLISIENVIGTPGNDKIVGDQGSNEIDGNGEDTTDDGDANTVDADVLDGGLGSDTIVVMTTGFNLGTSQEGENPNIKGFENIKGKLADGATAGLTITGDNNPNIITGTTLADTLNGEGGNDTLNGNEGSDNLNGGAGADTLTGGAGRDILMGGEGGDCFQLAVPDISGAADNNESRGIIRATLDSIRSYGEGDSISVSGATGDVGSGEGDTAGDVRVQAGRIVVIIVAADSAATPAVTEVSENLATVSGLTAENLNTVSSGTCPARTP